MLLKEFKTDITVEKQIVTSMIVSTDFLNQFAHVIKPEYFENSFIRIISNWILKYYSKHKEAPKSTVQSIFDIKTYRKEIDSDQSVVIEKLLLELSSQVELLKEFNLQYFSDIAERYFKRREMELTVNAVNYLIEEDRVEDAELEIVRFNKISRAYSSITNPFDTEEVEDVFDEINIEFFQFPGKLGEFLGPFERGWLVGISGPFKRGKTWFAQEFAIQGMLSFKKVLFFSLEMTRKNMNERIYRRLTVTGDEAGDYVMPVMDCEHNQEDTCELPERQNDVRLLDEDDRVPEYDENLTYKVCTYCRDHSSLHRNFRAAVWYETRRRPEFSYQRISRKLDALSMYEPYLRLKTYPRFSANVDDIRRDIELAEHIHDFVPDIIVVDYADILKPEDRHVQAGFDKEDRTWIALAQLANERNALVVAPSQVTKQGQSARIIKAQHQARWVGKLGHVDAMLTMNQTAQEKELGIMNIGIMAHRHRDFNENSTVMVLQQLKLGQTHLDSEIVPPRIEEDEE